MGSSPSTPRTFAIGCALLCFSCGVGTDPLPSPGVQSSSEALTSSPAGALIKLEMSTTVGALLDEIPAGSQREAAAADLLQRDNSFWAARAATQVQLTNYRLVFRGFFCSATNPTCGPLPLPPKTVRNIDVLTGPTRTTIGAHDYVVATYHFSTYIVTDTASPAMSDPALANVGGHVDEPFILPADPELLFQRTGYACMDEGGFPPNSVFEESTDYFYDQTCVVETPATQVCHFTQFPHESCKDSLADHVGSVTPHMRFTRVAYDPTLAAQYRVGQIVNPKGADLAVVAEAMSQENRIYYQYFTPQSCEVFEGTASPGWRRLLSFSANVRNDGTQPIHMGDVTDPNNPWQKSNDFEFSSCHQHYHFSFYGNFSYGSTPGLKRAFCLEDTNRYHNDETTALLGVHQTCNFQGIQPGWGDEYQYGISGQWVDITGLDTSQAQLLSFQLNPQQMLCEGQTLDVNNRPVDPTNLSALVFDPTNLIGENGQPVSRVRCKSPSNWNADNLGTLMEAHGPGSFVNDACKRGQVGPKRDCDFDAQTTLHSCTPGSTVSLQCHTSGNHSVLRICEKSAVLGGIACTYRNSVANRIVDGDTETVSFTCPAVRDSTTGAGGYSVYRAPLLATQSDDDITCTGW